MPLLTYDFGNLFPKVNALFKHGNFPKNYGNFPIEDYLNENFLDIFRALSDQKARFLVVGAFAVSVHAEPRATGDIDIWIDPTQENAKKVYEALQVFGAPLQELTQKDLMTPNVVFQMGISPNRIDFVTSVSGLSFIEAWKTRIVVRVNKIVIPVLGREALIKNKKAAGRPKDLIDLELLKKHKK